MNYKVLNFEDAYKRVKEEKVNFPGRQRSDNFAFEIICKNLNVLLFPSLGNKVILFESVGDYNDFFTQNTIVPLPEPMGNIFTDYQENIINIESNIVSLVTKLGNILNIELILNTNTNYISATSTIFNKHIKKVGKDTALTELSFLTGIYCGELIKKHLNKGVWVVKKLHGINSYLVPDLIIDDESIIVFKAVMDEMQRNKLNVKNCINRLLPMNYPRLE